MSYSGLHMLNQKYSCLYIVILLAIVALCMTVFLADPDRRFYTGEWGPIESLGVVLYILAIAILVTYSRYDRPFFIHTAIVLAIMAARELDFQTAFTSKNMLNKHFFDHGAEGYTPEQIVAAIAVGIIGLVVLAYLRYFPRLIANLKKRKAFAYSIVTFILVIPVTVIMDGAYRVLHNEWGLPLPLGVKDFLSSFEELLESSIPIMIIWAFLQYRADRRRESAVPPARETP